MSQAASEPDVVPGQFLRFGGTVALATFLLDQANKWWMLEVFRLPEKGRVTVTPFLDLVFVKNTGISYGAFSLESQQGQYLLAGIALVIAVGLAVWLHWAERRLTAWALALLIGGALGNALDRVLIGGVADFYSLHAFGYYWYVFNLADVAIVVGAALLLYESLRPNRKSAANGA